MADLVAARCHPALDDLGCIGVCVLSSRLRKFIERGRPGMKDPARHPDTARLVELLCALHPISEHCTLSVLPALIHRRGLAVP